MSAKQPTVENLRAALQAGDADRAASLIAQLGDDAPRDALVAAAELLMRRKRWTDAADTLSRIAEPDAGVQFKRNTARNFAALQQHRPALYEAVAGASLTGRYRFTPVAGNRLTIADCRDAANPLLLTPGGDPAAFVHQAYQQLDGVMKQASGVGLVGIGDGYLLGVLAKAPPKGFLDLQQSVFLFEPDLDLILACLMLHDYSCDDGPIAQPRFEWFVGPLWLDTYRDTLRGDLLLPPADALVQQSVDREQIAPQIDQVNRELNAQADRWGEQVEQYYQTSDGNSFVDVCGQAPPRPPRVMLLTTRFSTVLQYATRDTAAAFDELGWESQVVIEPSPRHRVTRAAIRRAMLDFQPDLIFQIDHLRHEHDDLFPPNLPFVCWVQDHLPNLTSCDAGAAVGPRDFVLTFAAPMFIDDYGYPAEQCIDMPMMLTRPRDVGAAPADTPDIVYVSNVSQEPAKLVEQLPQRVPNGTVDIAEACARRIFETYDAGGALTARRDIRDLIAEFDADLAASETGGQLAETLWNPLNIALYRQQGLAWAAEAADALGLSLGVYGRGWENHPRFKKYARGVVENGDDLATLTHHAAINLNLEPYCCFTHQRLLDGLMADGFFLIREFEGNVVLQRLLDLLEERFDDNVQTMAEALDAAAAAQRPTLTKLIAAAAPFAFDERGDAVRQVRCMQRAGVLLPHQPALPLLDDVAFADAVTFRARVEQYINDADARRRIARTQRESIEHRLTFKAGIERVIDEITTLIVSDSQHAERPAAVHAA